MLATVHELTEISVGTGETGAGSGGRGDSFIFMSKVTSAQHPGVYRAAVILGSSSPFWKLSNCC